MKRLISLVSGTGAFFLLPLLGAVTPLLVLPVVTSQFGSEGLAAYGIALSVGSAGALVAELGWPVVGPMRLPGLSNREQKDLYLASVGTRGIISLITVPVCAVVTLNLVQSYQFEAAVISAGFALASMSSAWFYVGLNKPIMILSLEGLPRLGLYVIAAVLMVQFDNLLVFGAAVIAVPLVAYIASCLVSKIRLLPSPTQTAAGFRSVRRHLPVTLGRGVASAYTAMPTALVAVVAPNAVALFTGIERLLRMAASILVGFHNRLQSWAGSSVGLERRRRADQQLLLSLGLALVTWLGFGLLAPLVAELIYSGTVSIPLELSFLAGLVLASIVMTRSFGFALVAIDRANRISIANLVAALCGVSAILVLTGPLGVRGALLGELVAELICILVQALIYWRLRRLPPSGEPSVKLES